MRTPLYLVLLALAVWRNWKDWRMLALTAAVAASIFIPAPTEWPTYYIFCGLAEIVVALVALRLRAAASVVIASICAVLVFVHFMGYYRDGSHPFSQYRALQAILELSEILCLSFIPASSRLRNRGSQ